MKAARLHTYGDPEVLVYEDAPDPTVQAGGVLVRVAAASINPFDLFLRQGHAAAFMPLTFPAIIGIDFAGTVEAVAPGVTKWKVGDRVFGVSGTYTGAYAGCGDAADSGLSGLGRSDRSSEAQGRRSCSD